MSPINQANDFWGNESRVQQIRSILYDLHKGTKLHPISKITTFVSDSMIAYKTWYEAKFSISVPISPPSEKQIRDFVSQKTDKPRDETIISFLVAYLERSLRLAGDTKALIPVALRTDLEDLAKEFWHHCEKANVETGQLPYDTIDSETKRSAFTSEVGIEKTNLNPLQTIDNIQYLLGTQRFIDSTFDKIFGDPENEKESRYFLIYRFSLKADHISKEYIQIRKPNKVFPFLHFARFYCDKNDRQREANGMVIGTEFATYLFGSFDRGRSIYCSAITTQMLHRRSFLGVQLGSDSTGQIYSSRSIFIETEIDDSRNSDIGIFNSEEIFATDKSIKNLIRNEVNIQPSGLTINGKLANKAYVQSHFDQLLRNLDSVEQVMQEGDLFNPMDKSQLPFSSSLSMLTREK